VTTPSPDARFRQTTPAPRAIRLGGLVVAALGLVVVVATGGGAVGKINKNSINTNNKKITKIVKKIKKSSYSNQFNKI